MTIIATVMLAVFVPLLAYDLLRRPTVRRLGIRNVARRKGEAALVIAGSMLATALITASFVIGNSFATSFRSEAIEYLGTIDEVVPAESLEKAEEIASSLSNADNVDATAVVQTAAVSVVNDDPEKSIPQLSLGASELAEAASFADGPLDSVPELGAMDVVIAESLAKQIGSGVGDQIPLSFNGRTTMFVVAAVVAENGFANYERVLVSPAAIEVLGLTDAVEPVALISNDGDEIAGARHTEAVVASIKHAAGDGVTVEAVKDSALDDAERAGEGLSQLFGMLGGFSVAAGILLIINLFVMLAEERKLELATLRAVGVPRSVVRQALIVEGAIYGVIAAFVGAVGGVGVGGAVVWAVGKTLVPEGIDFSLTVDVRPMSLLSGAIIGLAISLATVAATAHRVSGFDIVPALKDQASTSLRRRRWTPVAGASVVAGCIAGLVVAPDSPLAFTTLPVLGLLALILVLTRILPERPVQIAALGAALTWLILAPSLGGDAMADMGPDVFLAQGVLMTGTAAGIIASTGSWWHRAISKLMGGVGGRLGLAYPLARPGRLALLVSMFSLVLFTITILVTADNAYRSQVDQIARQATGDYDMIVFTNPSLHLGETDVEELPEVRDAVAFTRAPISAAAGVQTGNITASTTVVASVFADGNGPEMSSYSGDYASPRELWSDVVNGDTPVVVAGKFVGFQVGDTVLLENTTGDQLEATVVGLVDYAWLTGDSFFVGPQVATALANDALEFSSFYVATDASIQATGAYVEEQLSAAGADAIVVRELAQTSIEEQGAFFSILTGYLGLGLVIGLSGLGVVLYRSIRERRRQVGILKAIGVSTSEVSKLFMTEALFTGLLGALVGIGLGLINAWQLMTRSAMFEDGLRFQIPWVQMVIIAAIAGISAALTGVGPARRAAHLPPAQALRLSD